MTIINFSDYKKRHHKQKEDSHWSIDQLFDEAQKKIEAWRDSNLLELLTDFEATANPAVELALQHQETEDAIWLYLTINYAKEMKFKMPLASIMKDLHLVRLNFSDKNNFIKKHDYDQTLSAIISLVSRLSKKYQHHGGILFRNLSLLNAKFAHWKNGQLLIHSSLSFGHSKDFSFNLDDYYSNSLFFPIEPFFDYVDTIKE